MRGLVSHQSFPQLWKKLWKFAGFAVLLSFRPDFSRILHDRHAQRGLKPGFAAGAGSRMAEFRAFRAAHAAQ
jgi:hypothetical protein